MPGFTEVIDLVYSATIKADSVSPEGYRITTYEATYWRGIHSEMMTPRAMARNSASTRAIPSSTQILNLLENPFVPEKFGINQPGMQAIIHLDGLKHEEAVAIWLSGRDRAVTTTIELLLGRREASALLEYDPTREHVPGDVLLAMYDEIHKKLPKSFDAIDLSETTFLNVHKQLASRDLEPYMFHTAVITMTEDENFYALRIHPDAQGEINKIAQLMRDARDASTPRALDYGEYHLPYVEEGEFDNVFDGIRSSSARAAAASYGRQNAKNPEKEFERYNDLKCSGHMSPLEHQARPFSKNEWRVRHDSAATAESFKHSSDVAPLEIAQIQNALQFSGNFRGWRMHRKDIVHEDNFGALVVA